ncbi:MAG: hypothetical protein WC319_08520 [Candidatus Paceibacterota bacterium]|jgi:hypothetical protein
MENLNLYENFKSVPDVAKKTIPAGRLKGMTDINPMWRIKSLTEQFGPCGIGWKYTIKDQRLEKGANEEIAAFVTIDLFYLYEGKWSEAIPGVGGSSFVAKEKNGMYQSDECFKMALTDAIGIACKALGMAADVYFQKDRTKYDQTPPAQIPKPGEEVTPELAKLLSDVAMCTTTDELKELWVSNPDFHNSSILKQTINKLKETL